MGFSLECVSLSSDEEPVLMQLLGSASQCANLVIMTGGMGPTEDDITKKTVSRFLKRSLRYDEEVKSDLEKFFASRKRSMPENCLRQALVPLGSRIIKNTVGTAPGIILDDRDCTYILLPGPPEEMQPMFEEMAAPYLQERFGKSPFCREHLRLTGIPESALDQAVSPIYKKYKNIQTTVLSKPGDIELIFTGRDNPATVKNLNRLTAEITRKLEPYIYSTQGFLMEEEIGVLLKRQNLTISLAESCTGGLLAKRLTDIPGSSIFLLGGVVCYSNESKIKQVGVPSDILEKHGAVSSATAAALAAGIQRKTGSSTALAITGIAGPGGGTPSKPVGRVYIGALFGEKLEIKKFFFHGNREMIRFQSTQMAMEILRRMLIGIL